MEVLAALSTGPKTKTELKRACGYDVVCEYPTLDRLLQDMRIAGILECRGKTWELSGDKELCPTCRGRGIWDKKEPV
jgi:hypothetical protein